MGEKGELGKYEWKIANWDLNSGWFYWLQCNLVLSDFEGQTEDSNDSLWVCDWSNSSSASCSAAAAYVRLGDSTQTDFEGWTRFYLVFFVLRTFRALTRTSVLWCQNACQVRKMRTCWQICSPPLYFTTRSPPHLLSSPLLLSTSSSENNMKLFYPTLMRITTIFLPLKILRPACTFRSE